MNRDAIKFRYLLPWLETLPAAAGPIVDLGSGEGLLTCFVAMLNPDRPVLGVDVIPEAVATATEIAANLGVANVSFATADCLAEIASLPGGPFAMATAFTFFGPALGLSRLELAPVPGKARDQLLEHVPTIPGLGDLVDEGGMLVTADRFSGSCPAWWFEVTYRAGYQMCDDLQMLPMSMSGQLYCSVARRTLRPSSHPYLYLRHISDDLIAVNDGGAVGLLVGDTGQGPASVPLDPRDVSRLSRALSRRHIDFVDRRGDLTVFRSSSSTKIIARSDGLRQDITLAGAGVDALRAALEQLSDP